MGVLGDLSTGHSITCDSSLETLPCSRRRIWKGAIIEMNFSTPISRESRAVMMGL